MIKIFRSQKVINNEERIRTVYRSSGKRLAWFKLVFFSILACFSFAAQCLSKDRGIGSKAPFFDLQRLGSSANVSSSELFSEYSHVFVLFWSSECPHCVESLTGAEKFNRRYGGPDVAVVGINADDSEALAIKEMIERVGASFLQLRDPGGIVWAAYDIPPQALAVVHVERGRLAGILVEPEEDLFEAMERMYLEPQMEQESLEREEEASTEMQKSEKGEEGIGRFSIRVGERVRTMIVDSRSPETVGLYGEAARAGRTVLQRLEAEATASVAKGLRVGGLLRISNENEEVLEKGPAYYSSEWGSAFVEAYGSGISIRLGYYSIYMTPLTLQRWDWEDNPRIGGDAGCGCGPSAGTILFESLEELGPKLTFEGALAEAALGDFEARFFYAMPRRALETRYEHYRSKIAPYAHYSLEVLGGEIRWQRFDGRTRSSWKLSARALYSFENRFSVDFGALGYPAVAPWHNVSVASFSAEVPVFSFVHLRAEVAPWSRTVTENWDSSREHVLRSKVEGKGFLCGIVHESGAERSVAVDYVRLDPDYAAPFMALSYEPNAEGVRASVRQSLFSDRFVFSIFYKRLRELRTEDIYRESEVGRRNISLAGLSLDSQIGSAWSLGCGGLERRDWRDGVPDEIIFKDSERHALVAYISRTFGKLGIVSLQYQRVSTGSGLLEDPYGDIWSIDSSVRF